MSIYINAEIDAVRARSKYIRRVNGLIEFNIRKAMYIEQVNEHKILLMVT